jgi:hypothetical protein
MSRKTHDPAGPQQPHHPTSDPEARELEARLRESGVTHVRVDQLLGRSAMGSLFLGFDAGRRRLLVIKLLESDLAYDVGGEAFVRGIGALDEMRVPHVLAPRGSDRPGTICYVSPLGPSVSLAESLDEGTPLNPATALTIAADAAAALARWHAHGVAHGAIGLDALAVQNGQLIVLPPPRPETGGPARQRDVQALAGVALELLHRVPPLVDHDGRLRGMEAELEALHHPAAPVALSAERLAERLRQAALEAEASRGSWISRFRRWLRRRS